MTGTMTEAKWLIDASGSAGGVGLVEVVGTDTETAAEPWLQPLGDDGRKFAEDDEDEDELGEEDELGDDAEDEEGEFDEDDEFEDEDEEFFDDDEEEEDLDADLDEDEDEDF